MIKAVTIADFAWHGPETEWLNNIVREAEKSHPGLLVPDRSGPAFFSIDRS